MKGRGTALFKIGPPSIWPAIILRNESDARDARAIAAERAYLTRTWRLMARVLGLVPTPGLEAVLVAVELALDGSPPSAQVSVEHVINVLARLNAAPRPADVQTLLQVLTPPIADAAHYNRLRDIREAGHA